MSEVLAPVQSAQLEQIINNAETIGLVSSAGTGWQFNSFNISASTQDNGGTAPGDTIDVETQATIQNAIAKSNAAAQLTPQAVVPDSAPSVGSAQPDTNAINTKVTGIISDFDIIAKISDDIAALHGDASGAKLHWWGWEAQLNEAGAKGLRINNLNV